jgi:hypothetical protein
MAAQGMVDPSFGQQGGELLPDGFDDAWLECGHEDTLLPSRNISISTNDRSSMSAVLRVDVVLTGATSCRRYEYSANDTVMIFWRLLLPTPAESRGFYATLPEQCGVEDVEQQALCEDAAASYSGLR